MLPCTRPAHTATLCTAFPVSDAYFHKSSGIVQLPCSCDSASPGQRAPEAALGGREGSANFPCMNKQRRPPCSRGVEGSKCSRALRSHQAGAGGQGQCVCQYQAMWPSFRSTYPAATLSRHESPGSPHRENCWFQPECGSREARLGRGGE